MRYIWQEKGKLHASAVRRCPRSVSAVCGVRGFSRVRYHSSVHQVMYVHGIIPIDTIPLHHVFCATGVGHYKRNQVWNTAEAEPFVRRFLGHSDHVKRCAFADGGGEAVLSCGNDGTASIHKHASYPCGTLLITFYTRVRCF